MSLDEYEGTRKPKRQGDELILGALERRSRLLHVMPAEHTVALKNGNAFSSRQCNNKKQNPTSSP